MTRSVTSQAAMENWVLAALPSENYRRLVPHLAPVTLHLGGLLYEPDGRLDSLYFPAGAVISLIGDMEDGTIAEVGLVGNDGVMGIALLMEGETSLSHP